MHPDLDRPRPECEDEQRRAIGQQLRELSQEMPPPFGWSELKRRAQAQDRYSFASGRWLAPRVQLPRVALAAGFAALIALAALWGRWSSNEQQRPTRAAAVQVGVSPSALDEQVDASQRWLESLPDDRAIVRVSTRVAVMDLEDRIASMDDALNAERLGSARPGDVQALQHERARLLECLAKVRYAETLAADLP